VGQRVCSAESPKRWIKGSLLGLKQMLLGRSAQTHLMFFLLESFARSLLRAYPRSGLGEHPVSLGSDPGVPDVPVCVSAGQKVLIIEDLEDAEVQEGSSATFCCRISPADYKPVHWFLDKTPLSANELNEIEAQPGGYHVLTLRQLALKDSGTVHFEAGDQRTSAALQVTGRLQGQAQCMVGTSPYG